MASVIYPVSKTECKLDYTDSIETRKSDCGRVVIAKGNIFEGIPAIW